MFRPVVPGLDITKAEIHPQWVEKAAIASLVRETKPNQVGVSAEWQPRELPERPVTLTVKNKDDVVKFLGRDDTDAETVEEKQVRYITDHERRRRSGKLLNFTQLVGVGDKLWRDANGKLHYHGGV